MKKKIDFFRKNGLFCDKYQTKYIVSSVSSILLFAKSTMCGDIITRSTVNGMTHSLAKSVKKKT